VPEQFSCTKNVVVPLKAFGPTGMLTRFVFLYAFVY
jgi:hypothetical protein